MPKVKTHSGAKKRFNVTGGGKIKRASAYIGHKLTTSKSRKQKNGLHDDPGKVKSPLFVFDQLEEREKQDITRVHILMLGGGPEIRAKTYPVFHQRNYQEIFKEIINFKNGSLVWKEKYMPKWVKDLLNFPSKNNK